MATKVDLGDLREPDTPQVQEDFLRIFEEALSSSDDPATAAAKLADDLRQFLISSESENAADTSLWNLWMILLGVVMTVPVEHPWQAALVATVEGLRSTGGPVVKHEVGEYSPIYSALPCKAPTNDGICLGQHAGVGRPAQSERVRPRQVGW